MSDWPRVSVIVVNMDGQHHLKPCFESLAELEYPSSQLELILVDNGSQDDSVKYVRRNFPHVRVIENQQNEGFAGANNQGTRAATGEYAAFLNNDMRAHPTWLRELVSAARSAGDVAAVGGKILNWEGNAVDFEGGAQNFYGMGFQPHDAPPPEDQLTEMLFGCGGSLLVDRQTFLNVGGFDEDYFAYFEDVDLGWRLWLLGHRVLYAPRALTYHRGHGTSSRIPASIVAVLYERNALYSIIKNYDEQHLLKVLPVALFLLTRRAMIFGHIDKQRFRMPRSASSGPAPLQSGLPSDSSELEARHIRREFMPLVRELGLRTVLRESVRRAMLWVYVRLGQRLHGEIALVRRHLLGHLVAADDVIDAMPSLMTKRAQVQSRRKRSDAEILPLFDTPFHPHPPFEEYVAVQEVLTRLFEIDEIFQEQAL